MQGQGGDENFNLYAVDPVAPLAADWDVPPSRDLTGLQGVRVQIYAVPKDSPDIICLEINARDSA
ncbi:MAG: hypothetical protein ACUVR8_09910 [Acidobacteriota bacterium]